MSATEIKPFRFLIKVVLISLLVSISTGAANAQSDAQLWTNLSVSAPIENGFTMGGDVGCAV